MTIYDAIFGLRHWYEEYKAKKKSRGLEPWDEHRMNMLLLAIETLERQTHNCKDCRHADYTKRENVIYCLEHGCMMSCDNCCRDWSENDE